MTLTVSKTPVEADLIEKIEPVLEQMGYALRDVEVIGSHIIRVTLEFPDPSGPEIGIDDCSKAHNILSPLFDVWDPLPSAYTLELSSPGEKANLRVARHFEQAVGGEIEFQTLVPITMPEPLKPRRNWAGKLLSFSSSNGDVRVVDGYGEHTVNVSQMKSATWLRDWSPAKPMPVGSKNKAGSKNQNRKER